MRKSLCLILFLLSLPFLLVAGHAQAWTTTANCDAFPAIGSTWMGFEISGSGQASIDYSSGSPGGEPALKLHFIEGSVNGQNPVNLWTGLSGNPREIWVQYYFKYASTWVWNGINNKHWYLMSDASSQYYRLIFGINGDHKYQVAFSVQSAQPGVGTFSNTGYEPYFVEGNWYKVDIHVNGGTPGVGNGSYQVWINDRLVQDYSGQTILKSTDIGFAYANLDPVWGGYYQPSHPYYYLPAGMDQWFDKFTISTDGRISSSGVGVKVNIPNILSSPNSFSIK